MAGTKEAYAPPPSHGESSSQYAFRGLLIAAALFALASMCILLQSVAYLALPLIFAIVLTRLAGFGIPTSAAAVASAYCFFLIGGELATASLPDFDESQLWIYNRVMIAASAGSSLIGVLLLLLVRGLIELPVVSIVSNKDKLL